MRALRVPVWTLALLFVTLSISQAKTNYAYVANFNANTVSVINTGSNTVVKTVSVGTNPFAVAVDQVGQNVYVTNYRSASVSVISTSTNTVAATIPVGSNPAGVVFAPNGRTVYVANLNSGSVSVINTATKKVIATITVQSEPQGMAILPNGTFLYVGNYKSNTVSVISTLTNAVVATVNVGLGPTSLASSPDGSTVYVTDFHAGQVSVIQTATNSVIGTIGGGCGAPYGDAVSPDGHWLYVACPKTVAVIDTSTRTVAASIPFTGGAYYVSPSFSQDSAFAYVTGGVGTATVTVINTATKTIATTVTVGSDPAGVAVMGTVKVSTVAGGYVGDRGPATKAALGPDSSVLDPAGNLYISDFIGGNRIRKVDTTGTISTYAGTGICGYNGDKIAASKATICTPDGLALDPSGNLVFADDGNARIRKIDHSTGKITTIAGNGVFGYNANQDGGPALSAEIGQAAQIAYDAAGNLYFDQVGNCVVRKVDTSGIIHTVAGTATCGYNGDNIPATTAQLNRPHGVATDNSGNLYIGDSANHRVRKVDTSGTITTFAGTGHRGFSCNNGGFATSANVGNPRGLTISNNVLYIGNGGPEVCSVNLTTNIISLYAGSFLGYDGDGNSLLASKFSAPTYVIFDPSGNPIFDDNLNGRVRKATGGIVQTIAGGFINDGAAPTSAAFMLPEALAIDKSGDLYIADTDGNRIRKVSGGKISTVAGNGISGHSGDGNQGNDKNTELNEPQGVTVDSLGRVFIADTFNDVIRYVDTSGIINPFATNANFSFLLQMATDSSNNIYVADAGACVIWKITPPPAAVVSIVAGVLNTCGYNGDGIAATLAKLNVPYGVAFDPTGNMYIADAGNNRVREVNTSGNISTIAGNGTCGYTGDGASATAAELCPNSVAVDKSGAVYVADFTFERIRKISGGIITTFAGAGFGFNGDGLWPLYTTFDDPVAVVVDSKGAVYELDDWDHRVRKIQ